VQKRFLKYGVVVLSIAIIIGGLIWREYLSLEPEDAAFAWSPDGQYLVFTCHRRRRDRVEDFLHEYSGPYKLGSLDWYELCVVGVDSSDRIQLTRNTHYDGFPTWSPDGRHIAYLSKVMGEHNKNFIQLLTLDALDSTTLMKDEQLGSPSWSPVGSWLAFKSSGDLHLLDVDTMIMRKLTTINSVHEFDWSPDGEYIVFTSGSYPKTEVFSISVRTATMEQITFDGEYKSSPVWSPNGDFIAFTKGERLAQVYITDVSTYETTQFSTETGSLHEQLTWSPDSSALSYIRTSYGDAGGRFLEIKELNQDTEIRSYRIDNCGVLNLQWSPNSKYLALNQCADWNRDGWSEFKIWLFDVELSTLRPLYTTFPWQIPEQTLANVND
jgi:Tol biopolymer transport system component